MPLLLVLVLGLLALTFVLAPLFRARPASAAATVRLNDAIARADEAKQALRDVEFDHQLGNLEERDYEELRAAYERRALGALKTRYEREQTLDALLDCELATTRAQVASETATTNNTPSAAQSDTSSSTQPKTATPPARPRPGASSDHQASRGPRARRKGV